MGAELTAFSVRATQEQAERWQAAAEVRERRNVGAWLATLATERLRQLGHLVPRIVLRWQRARFRVMAPPPTTGPAARFGVYLVSGLLRNRAVRAK